jgi:hypothetical protein
MAEKHTKYIVAGCTTLAPFEYTNRHNNVAGYIQWTISKLSGLQGTDKYRIYSHNLRTFFPSLAAENPGCVKYADFFLWRS